MKYTYDDICTPMQYLNFLLKIVVGAIMWYYLTKYGNPLLLKIIVLSMIVAVPDINYKVSDK